MYQFSLCAFADEADPSVEGQIRALKENGISQIELRGVESRNVLELSVAEMKALRERLNGEGISVWSIGSPIGKIEITDDFEAHCEKFRHALELANVAGAGNMRIFSFFMDEGTEAQHKNKVIDQMGKFADLAAGTGIVLCHENEKGLYGGVPERCVDVHKALPSIRAVFDPCNFVQTGADTLKAWEMLEPYVEYMHIKDSAADMTIKAAGEGVANIPVLLEKFHKIGGKVLTLEPHLAEFVGLSSLEREGERSSIGNQFATNREAFDYAVKALRKLL